MLIEIIAAGIDADTVIPAKRPKYVLAADNIIDRTIPPFQHIEGRGFIPRLFVFCVSSVLYH